MVEGVEKKEFKLRWPVDTGPAIFTNNNATIQFDSSGMAYLTFFQAVPPVLMGSQEEQLQQLRELEAIEAKPVVKLAITCEQLKSLYLLLQKHAEVFDDRNSN